MKAQTCPFGMIMTSCLGKMLDKAKNQGKPRRYLRILRSPVDGLSIAI